MQQVEDPPIETIHLYVVREEEKRPLTIAPLFGAFLCLVGIVVLTVYSAYHPYYEHERLTIPATFFTRMYSATAQIIPTGVKTYPATTAHGTLTITNGSVISQIIPKGFTIDRVATDSAVFVPPGSANGYGYATVPAHAVVSGKQGNIPALAINEVEGSSVYIRNLHPFTGGKDSYSIKIVTAQDRQTAIDTTRAILAVQEARRQELLAKPCTESSQIKNLVVRLSWMCQYVTFTVSSYMKVTHVQLFGKSVLVEVVFVAKPRRIWVK